MAVKVNVQSFQKKFETALTTNLRKGLAEIAKKKIHWGIQGHDDLPLIMGVLNFGDPGHRVWNNAEGIPAPLPARPWLSQSDQGIYAYNIRSYIYENLPKTLSGIKKYGKYASIHSNKSLSIEEFLDGLAKVGAENARDSWDTGSFKPNAPMTLSRKSDPRPLHDTGKMNRDVITGWVS